MFLFSNICWQYKNNIKCCKVNIRPIYQCTLYITLQVMTKCSGAFVRMVIGGRHPSSKDLFAYCVNEHKRYIQSLCWILSASRRRLNFMAVWAKTDAGRKSVGAANGPSGCSGQRVSLCGRERKSEAKTVVLMLLSMPLSFNLKKLTADTSPWLAALTIGSSPAHTSSWSTLHSHSQGMGGWLRGDSRSNRLLRQGFFR